MTATTLLPLADKAASVRLCPQGIGDPFSLIDALRTPSLMILVWPKRSRYAQEVNRLVSFLIVISAVGFGVLTSAASPSVAGAASVRHLHADSVLASQRPSDVAPISNGYYEITLANGQTSLVQGTAAVGYAGPNSPELDKSLISLQMGTSSVSVRLPSGSTIQAGDVYATGDPGVQLTVNVGGASCSTLNGDPIAVEMDQVTWSTVLGSEFYAPLAAMQFSCVQSNGVEVFGAFSSNIVPTTPGEGYYTYESDGTISGFGNDNYLIYLGDLSVTPLNKPIVGMAITPNGGGYYLVASDGGIFSYGDAAFYGSAGSIHLNKPIVGMAATSDGKGYWLVASDGGIFSYGDAPFYGSTGNIKLNKPIVGMAATSGGAGYWLVASDGGIFAYGNAPFYGSTGSIKLNNPVVGMTPTPDGGGYWFVASDGGIFGYGDAQFYGSTGSIKLTEPIVGMAATQAGTGYWLVASDGGIFAFNAPFAGSLGGAGLTDIAGIAT
jgi:hypothetical protein